MQAVRAYRKLRDFTKVKSSWTTTEEENIYLSTQTGAYNADNYWYDVSVNKTVFVEEFLPVLEKENESVLHFLKRFGIKRYTKTDSRLKTAKKCTDLPYFCALVVQARDKIFALSMQLVFSVYCLRVQYMYDLVSFVSLKVYKSLSGFIKNL